MCVVRVCVCVCVCVYVRACVYVLGANCEFAQFINCAAHYVNP